VNVNLKTRGAGWTLVETLITVAIVAILAAIAIPVTTSFKQRAYRARAIEKLQSLGAAFVSYTSDSGGELPWEDAPGTDDWQAVTDPENSKVWYNALPDIMGAGSLASIAETPERMYDEGYPLYLKGAGYPKSNKKLGKPYFAMAMNSRLQRKNDDGVKIRGTFSSILAPQRTVMFMERGMPSEKKKLGDGPGQGGFDAGAKANPRAFVARYNGKGLLVFADGHVESFAVSDLITNSGLIIEPQRNVVWTRDPDEDPN